MHFSRKNKRYACSLLASIICYRVSLKQKALVTRLMKEGTGKTTFAIGDCANDVGMIQKADIGVSISGVEGMQLCITFTILKHFD
ncbi:probable phospholipid-transporting ATPase 4 [Tanacetum coccineum]